MRRRADDTGNALPDQAREISLGIDRAVVVPQIGFAAGLVRKIIQRAAAKAPEMLIAAFLRVKFGQKPQMPLADQIGVVSGFSEQ